MASGDEWDAQKILDLYIHDYMVKKNMPVASDIFAKEANVGQNPVVIETPDGFLTEWWSIFWDVYSNKQPNHQKANAESMMMGNELPNICPVVPRTEMNQQTAMQFPWPLPEINQQTGMQFPWLMPEINQQTAMQFSYGTDFDKMMGQQSSSLLAAKIYEEQLHRIPHRDLNSNIGILDVDKLAPTMPSSSNTSHLGQQVSDKSQQWDAKDDGKGISLGRSIPMDLTSHGLPRPTNPRIALRDAGKNKGVVNSMSLPGWPLTSTGPLSPGMGYQVLNSLLLTPNQQQQFQTSQVMAQTPRKPIVSLQGSTSNLNNPTLPRSDIGGHGDQRTVPMRQTSEKQMTVPAKQTAKQQQKDQQQLPENTRKRKGLSNSQAGESALDGSVAEADKPLEEIFESYLSHDDDNDDDVMSNSFSTVPRSSSACNKNENKGFSFVEVGSLHASKSKVLCCHFSTDGKLLASSGNEKKVLIWNLDTLKHVNTSGGHSHIVTDVRFRPNSTVFATSSFDKTVQIWDANKPRKSPFKLLGHAEQVISLDFHPRKVDLLCSCDSNDEIRLWNVNQRACTLISKGASTQVRFQPRVGNLLAAATGNAINLIDVETNIVQHHLEGHAKDVRSICWDTSGKYIASVSEDSARVWSTVSSGKCVHEVHSNGNKFESCTFHPAYSLLMAISSYQTLELWNPTENNKTLTVHAHDGIIAALADSPQTEMIASGSHDQWVKLWK